MSYDNSNRKISQLLQCKTDQLFGLPASNVFLCSYPDSPMQLQLFVKKRVCPLKMYYLDNEINIHTYTNTYVHTYIPYVVAWSGRGRQPPISIRHYHHHEHYHHYRHKLQPTGECSLLETRTVVPTLAKRSAGCMYVYIILLLCICTSKVSR